MLLVFSLSIQVSKTAKILKIHSIKINLMFLFRHVKKAGGLHDLQLSSRQWFNKVVTEFLLGDA